MNDSLKHYDLSGSSGSHQSKLAEKGWKDPDFALTLKTTEILSSENKEI